MMRLAVLLTIFSLSGCSSGIPVCITNIPKMQKECYDAASDYDENGRIKPDAVATIIKINGISDFNKDVSTTLEGLKNIKVMVKDFRYQLEECRSQLRDLE